jgi:hypothetical protein
MESRMKTEAKRKEANGSFAASAETRGIGSGAGLRALGLGGGKMKALKTLTVAALAFGLAGIGTAEAWDEVWISTSYSAPTTVYYTSHVPAPVYVYAPRPVVQVRYPAAITYVPRYSSYTYVSRPLFTEVTYIERW